MSFPPVVRGIVMNSDGDILITRHTKWDAMWVLPGGHVEPHESLQDALLRELQEEFGIRASFLPSDDMLTNGGKPLDMLPIPIVSYKLQYKNKEGRDKSRTEYIFIVTSDDEIRQTQQAEIAEYQWIDPEKLLEGKIKTYDFYLQILERLLYEEESEE